MGRKNHNIVIDAKCLIQIVKISLQVHIFIYSTAVQYVLDIDHENIRHKFLKIKKTQ